MLTYPNNKPRLNQTVYIKRPEWNRLIPARFTEEGFECNYRRCNFTIGEMDCPYIPDKEILWTTDLGTFLAQ